MSIIGNGNDQTILSKSDLEDKRKKKKWEKILRECHDKSEHIKECNDVRVVTSVDERLVGDNFTISELIPTDPSLEFTHDPEMEIPAFLILIGTILSTAFGFSLYTWMGCRWKRHKNNDACCFCGFTSKIEDPQTQRIIELEEASRADKELLAQLREELTKLKVDHQEASAAVGQLPVQYALKETVDPIKIGFKTLEAELKKMKKKVDKIYVKEEVGQASGGHNLADRRLIEEMNELKADVERLNRKMNAAILPKDGTSTDQSRTVGKAMYAVFDDHDKQIFEMKKLIAALTEKIQELEGGSSNEDDF